MLSIASDKKLGGAGNEAMVLPKLTNEMLEVVKNCDCTRSYKKGDLSQVSHESEVSVVVFITAEGHNHL